VSPVSTISIDTLFKSLLVLRITALCKIQAFNRIERFSNELLGHSEVITTTIYTQVLNHGGLGVRGHMDTLRRYVLYGNQINLYYITIETFA